MGSGEGGGLVGGWWGSQPGIGDVDVRDPAAGLRELWAVALDGIGAVDPGRSIPATEKDHRGGIEIGCRQPAGDDAVFHPAIGQHEFSFGRKTGHSEATHGRFESQRCGDCSYTQ